MAKAQLLKGYSSDATKIFFLRFHKFIYPQIDDKIKNNPMISGWMILHLLIFPIIFSFIF